MALRLTAEYINGSLIPLEPLDLEEGTLVTLEITPAPEARRHETILEATDRVLLSAPAGLWDNTPTDESKNYRHHLYDYPREKSNARGLCRYRLLDSTAQQQ